MKITLVLVIIIQLCMCICPLEAQKVSTEDLLEFSRGKVEELFKFNRDLLQCIWVSREMDDWHWDQYPIVYEYMTRVSGFANPLEDYCLFLECYNDCDACEVCKEGMVAKYCDMILSLFSTKELIEKRDTIYYEDIRFYMAEVDSVIFEIVDVIFASSPGGLDSCFAIRENFPIK